ncbi:RnaseH-domain-containing protein [Armillaria solidipes]|uniref:RnaseH-domain-containing protein n=1 Tax=Armillaria solidipes TaxID=1076256 RepID=A0A2H3BY70_9AGAR|nr:RnaseH-domain-containing protein [Armillaria solidipes]
MSDSKYVIEGLCMHLRRWEDRGWVDVPNSELWRATIAILRQHGAPIFFKWVKGHNGDIGNEGADILAGEGAMLDIGQALPVDTDIEHEFDVVGARLSRLTQSQAYKLVLTRTEVKERQSARITIQRVMASIKEVNGVEPIEDRIWTAIRKDISKPIRGFLWKALQNTFKIGSFWEHLGPQYATRGECPYCKVTETMEHILVDCLIEGRNTLWQMTQNLWERKGKEWIEPTYGIALGATYAARRHRPYHTAHQ